MRGTPAIYFKSLNRQFDILGVEKDIFFLNLGLCVPIAISARFSMTMDSLAVMLFVVVHVIARKITKTDPIIRKIYLRHIRYKKYYPTISSIHAKQKSVKISVPVFEGKNKLL